MLRLASARNGDTPGHASLGSIGESCQNKHVTDYGRRRELGGGGGGGDVVVGCRSSAAEGRAVQQQR